MGSTQDIKETNIGQGLINKTCGQCNKKFTEKDVCQDNNWEVEFDTSNDVELTENKVKGYGYNLTIWIRNIYHSYCDDAELAEKSEKTMGGKEWKELGEKIKNSHPLENYNETLKKVHKLKKHVK